MLPKEMIQKVRYYYRNKKSLKTIFNFQIELKYITFILTIQNL